MLINSNDAFFAILGVYARSWATVFVDARGYDAGTDFDGSQGNGLLAPKLKVIKKIKIYEKPLFIRVRFGILGKEKIMNVTLNRIVKPISLSIVFLLLLGFGYMDAHAQEAAEEKATFYVY
jgi:hypothetical protein